MDDARARELLAEARSTAEEELRRLEQPDPDDVEDTADEGVELTDDAFDAGRASELRDRLNAIERAEQRLAEGKYGLSVQSGDPIPDGRLELVPWADRTVEEESRLG